MDLGKRVVVKDVPESVDGETLELYLEAVNPGAAVIRFTLDKETGIAHATFETTITDWDLVQKNVFGRPLGGNHISVELDVEGSTVLVSDLPPTASDDTITYYFENHRRSGGGDVTGAWFMSHDTALVTFDKPEDFQNVLKRSHKIEGNKVHVQPFVSNPKLGQMMTQVVAKQPVSDYACGAASSLSLVTIEKASKYFQDKHDQGMFRNPSPSKPVITTHDVSFLKRDNIISVIQPHAEQRHDAPVARVKPVVNSIPPVEETIVRKAIIRPACDDKSEVIPEMHVDSMEIAGEYVNLLSKQIESIKSRGDVEISNTGDGQILLSSPSLDKINDTKLAIYELIHCVTEKSIPFPKKLCKGLQAAQRPTFLERILAENIGRATITVREGSIFIAAMDKATLDAVVSDVEGLKKKKKMKTCPEHLPYLASRAWRQAQDTLESDLLVTVTQFISNLLLEIVGIGPDLEQAIMLVQEQLEEHRIYEDRVPLKKGVWRLLQKYCSEEVVKATSIKSFSGENVDVQFGNTRGTYWLNLKGWGYGPPQAKKCFNEKITKLVKYQKFERIEPGLKLFLSNGTGKKLIEVVEERLRCSVEVRCRPSGLRKDHSQLLAIQQANRRTDRKSLQRSATFSGTSRDYSLVQHHSLESRDDLSPFEQTVDSEPGTPTCFTLGYMTVTLKKGDLVRQTGVDCLVHTVIGGRPLHAAGRLTADLLRFVGEELKREIEELDTIPLGEVVATSGGQLAWKYILHMAYGKWDGKLGKQRLEYGVGKCLEIAHQKKLSSIAFPAIGCGGMGYPPDVVAWCLGMEIQRFVQKYPLSSLKHTYIITLDEETLSVFRREGQNISKKTEEALGNGISIPEELSKATEVISLSLSGNSSASQIHEGFELGAECHEQNIESRSYSNPASRRTSFADKRQDVPSFTATIVHINAMSDEILARAKANIITLIEEHFHTEIVTHHTLSRMNDLRKAQVLSLESLGIAVHLDTSQHHVRLTGERKAVGRAAHKLRTDILVEDETQSEVRNSQFQNNSDFHSLQSTARAMFHRDRPASFQLGEQDSDFQSLQSPPKTKFHRDRPASFQFGEQDSDFHSLQSPSRAKFHRERPASSQREEQRGNLHRSRENRSRSRNPGVLRQHHGSQTADDYPGRYGTSSSLRPKRRYEKPQNYLERLAEEDIKAPPYWTKVSTKQPFMKLKHFLGKSIHCEPVDVTIQSAVEALIQNSWRADLVGHGRDAGRLRHRQIQVTSVKRIENASVYMDYAQSKKKMVAEAVVNPIPTVQILHGFPGNTKTYDATFLTSTLVTEVNECFLFHGTLEDNVKAVRNQGLDSRLGGASGMFGQGIYFAESSTKADQYTDKGHRKNGELTMLVVRVLLGKAFEPTLPQKFKRPPCTSCSREDCKDHCEFYDSVIGTKRSDGSDLLFREFVIYEKGRCYPEFVVKYNRI